jgi:hypothetical protein
MLDAAGKSVVPRRLQTASPASSVFALDSDLIAGGKTELERHAEVCSDDPHVLRAMCAQRPKYLSSVHVGLRSSIKYRET